MDVASYLLSVLCKKGETEFGDFWLEGGIVRAVVYGGRGRKLWAARGWKR